MEQKREIRHVEKIDYLFITHVQVTTVKNETRWVS